jgi:uncharacterized membrane protein
VNPNKWFGIVIGYTALTLFCVYLIPSDSVLSIIRIVLAFIFVTFAPGYCLISFLFEEGKLDVAEKLALSVALSFSLIGISGLFIGITSIGLSVASITESLGFIVVVLAVLAYLQKIGLIKRSLQKLHAKRHAQAPS